MTTYRGQMTTAERLGNEGRAEAWAKGWAEGWAEGLIEGRALAMIELLEIRFGPLDHPTRARAHALAAGTSTLVPWLRRALDAERLEDALMTTDRGRMTTAERLRDEGRVEGRALVMFELIESRFGPSTSRPAPACVRWPQAHQRSLAGAVALSTPNASRTPSLVDEAKSAERRAEVSASPARRPRPPGSTSPARRRQQTPHRPLADRRVTC